MIIQTGRTPARREDRMTQDQAIAQHWTAWPKHVIPAETVERQSAAIKRYADRWAGSGPAHDRYRLVRNEVVRTMARNRYRDLEDIGDPMAVGFKESWRRLCMLTSVLDHLIYNAGGKV